MHTNFKLLLLIDMYHIHFLHDWNNLKSKVNNLCFGAIAINCYACKSFLIHSFNFGHLLNYIWKASHHLCIKAFSSLPSYIKNSSTICPNSLVHMANKVGRKCLNSISHMHTTYHILIDLRNCKPIFTWHTNFFHKCPNMLTSII